MGTVPIKVTPGQKKILDRLKENPRETYSDAFKRLCEKPYSKICRRLKDNE